MYVQCRKTRVHITFLHSQHAYLSIDSTGTPSHQSRHQRNQYQDCATTSRQLAELHYQF